MNKTVYAYNGAPVVLDETDKSPVSGAWQIPAGLTEIEPPAEKDGFTREFNGETWEYKEIPVQTPVEPTAPPVNPIAELDAEFYQAKREIVLSLQTALLLGDEALIADIQEEYADLLMAYDEALAELEEE